MFSAHPAKKGQFQVVTAFFLQKTFLYVSDVCKLHQPRCGHPCYIARDSGRVIQQVDWHSNLRSPGWLSCGAYDSRRCSLSLRFGGRQAGVARGRLDAASHARGRTYHVFQDLVTDKSGQGVHTDTRAVLAVRGARNGVQQTCDRACVLQKWPFGTELEP